MCWIRRHRSAWNYGQEPGFGTGSVWLPPEPGRFENYPRSHPGRISRVWNGPCWFGAKMRVLPERGPRPRLLDSAVPDEVEHGEDVTPQPSGRVRRFVVRMVSVLLIATAVAFWVARDYIGEEAAAIRKLVAVGTRMLTGGTQPSSPPTPIVVQLNADLVQVTSIALGHPRLAIINNKQVTEGDLITVHTPVHSIAVTLRVLEISDRQVKLSDGTQVITAHLSRSDENQP